MRRWLALVAAALLALPGCASPEPEPVVTPSSPTVEPTTEQPEDVTWPLTGVALSDPDLARTSPVIGVKVENSGPARPWVGLAAADLVFVEMVEGGMTRFHAVYQSQVPETIMPVRSLRPMDAAILGPWNATLLASGGQAVFIARVETVVELRTADRGDPGFHRDRSRRAPHNVYVATGEIVPTLPESGEVVPFAEYDEVSPSTLGGEAAREVRVVYPGARSMWEYRTGDGTYARSDDGTPSVEVDGTRVFAHNVLLLQVTTRDTGRVDPAGNPVPETVLTGSGRLHLVTGGRVVAGTWSKGGDEDPFVLTDSAGEPLVLTPGTTWVELVPERATATWS